MKATKRELDLAADMLRFLPIRWKFHCLVSGKAHGEWNIHEWREYLLEKDYPIDIVELLTRQDFLQRVKAQLRDNGVRSLENLNEFWEQCVKDYRAELSAQSPTF